MGRGILGLCSPQAMLGAVGTLRVPSHQPPGRKQSRQEAALGKNPFQQRVRRVWCPAPNSQPQVPRGQHLEDLAVAGILTSCHRAVRSHSVLNSLWGGRNQSSWATLAGPCLAFWGLTVSLSVSELPARSSPEAQESHWPRGPQH